MIVGTHAIIYATDAEATREFFRDVLELDNVDAGDGWLIFKLPPAELGVHPSDATGGRNHELFLMCDDIEATVDEMRAKGVEVTSDIEARGFGLATSLRVPGAGQIGLYEPRHPTAYDR